MSEMNAKLRDVLYAYHDGELRGVARWQLERRLRREPQLRRELAALGRLGGLVRQSEAAAEPDLWDRIEQRLPAVDARREDVAEGVSGGWWRPLTAAAAAAVAIVAVWFAAQPGAPVAGVVRWMDSGGRSVMVLEDAEAEVTIIWMLDEAVEGAARGGRRDVV